jgi:carboxyl-terminal processing protease
MSSTLKRILTIACGAALGLFIADGAVRMARTWGLLPDGGLGSSSAYVRDAMLLVNEHYVDADRAGFGELGRSALHGLVESLDPHSEFMEAREFKLLEEDISSEFGGIGVQVEMRKGRVYIIAPVAGAPGERAGIRRGDEIVSIDGDRLERPTMEDVVTRLRGKPKSRVRLGLLRPDEQREYEVALTREVIRSESVREVRVLPDSGGTGYLQITQFTERTGAEFSDALQKLLGLNARALVIDLRNNPGGLLDAAVEVAEPFFEKGGLIVYTQGRRAGDRKEYRAGSSAPPLRLPLAVLINASSASAAEIVAGALKDTGRAVVVGERSFGKGSVQSIFELRAGEAVRLTTARYYTPGGATIHERGVEPQVEVVLSDEEDDSVALQLARPDIKGAEAFKERFGAELMPDRQLQAAVEVLRGVLVFGEGAAKAK